VWADKDSGGRDAGCGAEAMTQAKIKRDAAKIEWQSLSLFESHTASHTPSLTQHEADMRDSLQCWQGRCTRTTQSLP